MAAPVLTVPQGGPIAARPRREGLYDTEVYDTAGALNTLPFFTNTQNFAEAGGGAKVAGIDTNLIGTGGSIPRGHYLRVFGANVYVGARQNVPVTAAALDDKRKMTEASFWRLLLGSTPYLDSPSQYLPAGTGMMGPLASGEALSVGDYNQGWPSCSCYFDLTVPGVVRKQGANGEVQEIRVPRIPLEFAETESFTVNMTWPNRPVLTVVGGLLFITTYLVSIYLKPLAA